jgi:hypothetical protein
LKLIITGFSVIIILLTFLLSTEAQEVKAVKDTLQNSTKVARKEFSPKLSREVQEINVAKDTLQKTTKIEKKKISPKKATIYAALIPGLGQAYNGKYWKLPIVYGGYVGLVYIFGWNNNNYNDYSQAYRTIAKYTSTTGMPAVDRTYLDNFIKNPSINLDNPSHFSYVTTSLKSGKDFYRRNRDMTIIGIAALHILSIIDASVDANLSDFDISDDLSMKIGPIPSTMGGQGMVIGLNLALKF